MIPGAEQTSSEAAVIAITSGSWRDHRADLKQWMIALATTHDGEVALFWQPLDGKSSDKVSLLAAMPTIQAQWRQANGEPGISVAESGVYSFVEEAAVERGSSQVGESRCADLKRSESAFASRQ